MPVRDKGVAIEYDAKRLRFKNGGFAENQTPFLWDHFTEDLVAGKWTATETGAGTSHAPFAVAATANDGGQAVGVAGATTNNAQELAGKHIIWKPSLATNAPLVLEARFKVVGTTTATDGDFYFGLADAATYTNSLSYVVAADSTLSTSVPTEFAGFAYSSIATSGALFLAGGNPVGAITTKANVDTVAGSTVVKDSNFHVFRIEVNSAGNCSFYIDGNLAYTLGAAVTAATAFTPYLNIVGKNSHANTATVDYIYVGGDQVTT